MGRFFGKALIIDNDARFVEGIKTEFKLLEDYPCFVTKTFQEATKILKQPKHNIRVVFLSSSISMSGGLNELKEIRTSRPFLPIFLISHHPEREPKAILNNEDGFYKIIIAPKNFSFLTKEIDTLFISKETWADIQASEEKKNIEINLVKDRFIAVPLSDYVLTPKSFFNIFIQLGETKFVKILNAGDAFDKDLFETYARKGITHFYLADEEHKKYIRLCEELSKKVINDQEIKSSKKIHNILNFGNNIAQSLIHTGISEEKLDIANTFLNQSVHLIKNMKMKNESLKKFIETVGLKEHNATVSFLASMIANQVGLESIKSVKIAGITALLHDIGLYDLNPDFNESELENLDHKQQDIFDQHEKHGGQILRKSGNFDEVIYQAVENHHMRRRGSDHTRRTNNINMVTEIIGAADELHNIVITKKINDTVMNEFLTTNLKRFSPQIEKAILELLNKAKST